MNIEEILLNIILNTDAIQTLINLFLTSKTINLLISRKDVLEKLSDSLCLNVKTQTMDSLVYEMTHCYVHYLYVDPTSTENNIIPDLKKNGAKLKKGDMVILRGKVSGGIFWSNTDTFVIHNIKRESVSPVSRELWGCQFSLYPNIPIYNFNSGEFPPDYWYRKETVPMLSKYVLAFTCGPFMSQIKKNITHEPTPYRGNGIVKVYTSFEHKGLTYKLVYDFDVNNDKRLTIKKRKFVTQLESMGMRAMYVSPVSSKFIIEKRCLYSDVYIR